MINRLKKAREQAGLSVTQASRMLGWSGTGLLPELEDGTAQPTDLDVAKLADLYGVSVAWLCGEAVELPNSTRELLRDIEHTGDRARLTELLESIQGVPKP